MLFPNLHVFIYISQYYRLGYVMIMSGPNGSLKSLKMLVQYALKVFIFSLHKIPILPFRGGDYLELKEECKILL